MHTFADVASDQGEYLCVPERMVISPGAGIFQPTEAIGGATIVGEPIAAGAILGHIAGEEVRSPFAGTLMGMFALPGERLQAGQRIAWLRLSQPAV